MLSSRKHERLTFFINIKNVEKINNVKNLFNIYDQKSTATVTISSHILTDLSKKVIKSNKKESKDEIVSLFIPLLFIHEPKLN